MDRCTLSDQATMCWSAHLGRNRYHGKRLYMPRMVNSLTDKSLTPLMLACKRGCVSKFFTVPTS